MNLEEREERPAYVRFERVAKEDAALTLKNGRSTSIDVDFALITPPYSRDLVRMRVDRWMTNMEKDVRNNRLPSKWRDQWLKSYDAWKSGQEIPLNGTAIKEWSAISPATIANLIAINILTVEDLANANDEGLRRIGMGAHDLKRKASNWLLAASKGGKLALKLSKVEKERDALQITVDDLTEKNKLLSQQLDARQSDVDQNRFLLQQMESKYVPRQAIDASEIIDTTDNVAYNETSSPTVAETKSLSEQFHDKFGRKPHSRMSDENMRRKLAE